MDKKQRDRMKFLVSKLRYFQMYYRIETQGLQTLKESMQGVTKEMHEILHPKKNDRKWV